MNYSSILRKAVYDMLESGFNTVNEGCSRRVFKLNKKYIVKEVYDMFESAGGSMDIDYDSFNELIIFSGIKKEVETVQAYFDSIPRTGRAFSYSQNLPIAVFSMLVEHAISNILYKSGRSDIVARVLSVQVIEGSVYALCENAFELKQVNEKTSDFYESLVYSCMQFSYKNRLFRISDLHNGNFVNGRIVDYAFLACYDKADKARIDKIKANNNFIPTNYLKK